MSNYKFNLDPKDPREEQIARHKDFGKVMQNYQRMTHPLYRTPLYRFRRIFLAVLLVLFTAWLVIEFGEKNDENKKPAKDSVRMKDTVDHSERVHRR